ncbi:hypothetical protein D3C80_513830 [compost metagenome]
MNYKVMEALGTASTVAPGVIDMPYMRDGGFFDVAGATIQHNWDQSVGGLKNNLDPDYDFEPDKETLAQGLSEDSARIFKNGNYYSRGEAERVRGNLMKTDYLTTSAMQAGWPGAAGLMAGSMVDATAVLGFGAAAGTLKALNTSTKMMRAADRLAKAGASAKQVAAADAAVKGVATSVAFDGSMMGAQMSQGRADWQEVEDSILIGLAFTGAVGAPLYAATMRRSAEVMDSTMKTLDAGQNPLRDFQLAHMEADDVRKNADAVFAGQPFNEQGTAAYVKQPLPALLDKVEAPSRYSMTTNTEVDSINELGARLFQDPTYQRTNTADNIQATTADVEADKWTYSVEGELGEALMKGRDDFFKTDEGKAWKQKNGISVYDRILSKPINDRLGHDIRRHLYMGGRIDQLPAGMREMARAMDGAHRKTFEQMKRYGVEGTEDLEHMEGHMRRIHDEQAYRGLIHRYGDVKVGEEAMTAAMSESIYKGAFKEGKEMTRALSRRLALILQHRVLANDEDKLALEHFLTSPNIFYKEAREFLNDDAQAEALTREAFGAPEWKPGEAASKQKSQSGKYTMLRRRIPMDLAVPVPGQVNKWKEDFLIGDLMVDDPFELTHRYVRSGMGNAALAKQGLNSPDAIEAVLSKLRADAKFAKDGQKVTDAITRLEKGINRIRGIGAIEEVLGSSAKLAVVSTILGKHAVGTALGGSGIAAAGEMARVISRVGFKSLIDMVPAFRNASDKELLAMFKEFGYYYGNSRMLAYFSHIEDFGNNALGNIGALASQSAQTALRLSGLSLIDQLSRQSALIGWTRRLEKQVKSGKTGAKDFQLSEMGWKPETYETISGYIKAHGMKMDNWRLPDGRQDLATIEQFTSGAHKVVSENITRMMTGESNDWVDGPWGAMFLQFRKIVYATYNKSLTRGLSKPDAIMASNLVASLFGALMVNEMRNAVKTAGMGDEERDEYLKKYGLRYAIMNDGELLQPVVATLTYTPAGGPLAELLSLFSSQFLGIDLRGRHTGGPETFLQTPSIQLAENLMRGSAGLAMAPFQEDPNWKDIGRRVRAVSTAQNWYLMHPVVNLLTEELTEE